MPAILFGSISTVVDTSELQREAFNAAFAQHGLDWTWDRDDYQTMLRDSGGEKRIAQQAEQLGLEVDAAAVHATKSRIFRERLAAGRVTPRPGVVDTIGAARAKGMKVGLVTTTSPANVEALLSAVAPAIGPHDFDVVVDSDTVAQPKPDGAAYAFALRTLGEAADACVAIEDNVDGVRAATAAGVACVAFPNANTASHDFAGAAATVERLDAQALQGLIPRA